MFYPRTKYDMHIFNFLSAIVNKLQAEKILHNSYDVILRITLT
jgi:hypothetical protein